MTGIVSTTRITTPMFAAAELTGRRSARVVRELLEESPGYVIVTDLPGSTAHLGQFANCLRTALRSVGRPQPQHANRRLHVIRTDAPADDRHPFPTSPELFEFHTDAAYRTGRDSIDHVAVGMVRAAATGGGYSLMSADTLYRWLERHFPDAVETMLTPVPFDALGANRPSAPSGFAHAPMFEVQAPGRVYARVHRWRVNSAYSRMEPEIPTGVTAAMHALSAAFAERTLQTAVRLDEGQALVLNNRRLLHSRSAFTEREDSRRVAVRLWMHSNDRRT